MIRGLRFLVLIQEVLKVQLFAGVITKAALSPQLFKDPKCWSAGVELTTSHMAALKRSLSYRNRKEGAEKETERNIHPLYPTYLGAVYTEVGRS